MYLFFFVFLLKKKKKNKVAEELSGMQENFVWKEKERKWHGYAYSQVFSFPSSMFGWTSSASSFTPRFSSCEPHLIFVSHSMHLPSTVHTEHRSLTLTLGCSNIFIHTRVTVHPSTVHPRLLTLLHPDNTYSGSSSKKKKKCRSHIFGHFR
jgi:hypothetical protein